MNLELHHFFILVEPGGKVAELLAAIGMQEGTRNTHEGQGTSNRRFFFSNGALELLWIHSDKEAMQGPGQGMLLAERAKGKKASPFGVIFNRKDDIDLEMPFRGWKYKPDYFQSPWAFHIGDNSNNTVEPLCVYMPFVEPGMQKGSDENVLFNTISKVIVYTPSKSLSHVINVVNKADRLSVKRGQEHLMEITFNDNKDDLSHDFRPDIPLIVHW